MSFHGPAIVEQSDTTTVIEPDMSVTVDEHGNLLAKVK
jgi:N-methylhydantoinase A/oxoprolinase/acetone carboxylase beta subunit